MRFSRRVVKVGLRLLWTLLLVVFSAHHAAPNAPIWHGNGQHNANHAHHDHSSELVFSAIHADHNSHCELCFGSAFEPPVRLGGVPRVALSNPRAAHHAISLGCATDWRLPEAHAPPIV